MRDRWIAGGAALLVIAFTTVVSAEDVPAFTLERASLTVQ